MIKLYDTMKDKKRTHYCSSLRLSDKDSEVVVCGWVQRKRNLGSLVFVDLRDRTGIVQLTFDDSCDNSVLSKADEIRSEFVLCVWGIVRARGEGAANSKIPTGEIEIVVKDFEILSASKTPPFEITDELKTNEELRLRHRFLDLRRPVLQKNLMLRHRVTKITRDYFDANGFLEIETPMLIKSTPEGARDYVVPSRVHHGEFYALPQSPQLYKQLLMVSGFDRYMQIVRCFRDEDLRADRQPEFTQIDLEMSFVDVEDVLEINEGFIKRLFSEALGTDIETPIKRLTYREAMERYGSDKPDIRFGFELCNISDIVKDCGFGVFSGAVSSGGSVRAININGYAEHFSRKKIDSLVEFVKIYKAKGLAWIKLMDGNISSSFAKFMTEDEILAIVERLKAKDGDIVFIVADTKDDIVYSSLGALRCEIAKRLEILKSDDYKFLWVTEFPLLEYDEDEGRFVAKHHPFTSPMEEDIKLLDTDPSKARAKAYDIVLNGVEVGGGSIRIHSSELQEKMFSVLGISKESAQEKFGFLLNAFKYGVPPHGGLAFGLDRLVMLMTGSETIRDVIAFPKVQNASELMTQCPSPIDEKQLEELNISVLKDSKQV